MLLAALLDAGASVERLRAVPGGLGIGPVDISVERVARHGIGALQVTVVQPPDPPPRTWRRLREILEGADLEPRVRTRALAVFTGLAEAEAKIHGSSVDDVQFHELGGVDTLVDVCGSADLLEDLAVERVFC